MTDRARAVLTLASRARRSLEREATANGEAVHEATAAAVRAKVLDLLGAGQVDRALVQACEAGGVALSRLVGDVVREVEDQCGVRRGWWSRG